MLIKSCLKICCFFFPVLFFVCLDGEKGLRLVPFLSKFSSVKMVGKKGCVPIIDYKQLEKATGNFKESNIIGEGGFGCVYKARLDDNLDVAIKKLNCECQYAEREFEVILANNLFIYFVDLIFFFNDELEKTVLNSWMNFQNEVDLLSKIQHPNVISLLGCSSNEDSRFIVYELMQNGSLETQLHGKNIVSDILFYWI